MNLSRHYILHATVRILGRMREATRASVVILRTSAATSKTPKIRPSPRARCAQLKDSHMAAQCGLGVAPKMRDCVVKRLDRRTTTLMRLLPSIRAFWTAPHQHIMAG